MAQEKAAKVVLSAMERRSKLLGLDAPEQKKHEHTGAGGAPLGSPQALQLLYQRAEAGDERALAALATLAETERLPPAEPEREVVESTADAEPVGEASATDLDGDAGAGGDPAVQEQLPEDGEPHGEGEAPEA